MGAKYFWVVSVGGEILPNVQSISFSYGRTQPTDDFQAGSLQITGILPDSLPAEARTIGSQIVLTINDKATSSVQKFYYFTVQGLTRTYGTQPNLDTWNLTGVGLISPMTTQQLTSTYTLTAGNPTLQEADAICNAYGIISDATYAGSSVVSAQSYPVGTYINDIVQDIVRTEQGRIQDVIFSQIIFDGRLTIIGGFRGGFNDGTVAQATPVYPYTSIEFENDGDYLANTVIVEPAGLAAATTGTTRPVLNFQTVDQTTTQATSLSQYIKNTLDLNTVRPFSVTFLADAQSVHGWVDATVPGSQVTVALRGVSYNCVVEGASFMASPSATQIMLQLSSAAAYAFLRLNDAVFGTLDNNRLGF